MRPFVALERVTDIIKVEVVCSTVDIIGIIFDNDTAVDIIHMTLTPTLRVSCQLILEQWFEHTCSSSKQREWLSFS